ncbi:hypothetical protein O181_030705 [Austropuccinia psidii MF-1]|uniref:Uncharacterized protein n=1 Tax=Austropuccinia psidii MF-1 TaxID=1389203 RepID=A0A9Q3H6H3_9BASI|nr:hypothetical protein [Austropuccinia psidii MF-1]
MPIKHSPPARQTRSQARAQAVITPNSRVPLDGTPAVPHLRVQFVRNRIIQEGRKRAKKIKSFLRGTGGPTLAQSNQPVYYHSEPSLVAIMQQMIQIMANCQAASSSEASRQPTSKTLCMKATECFNGTKPFKVRSFIQSCQLIFHNDLATFPQDGKKVLYATSFLIDRSEKLIEPYLYNLTNQDPSYLLNYWNLIESHLFTLFEDPN